MSGTRIIVETWCPGHEAYGFHNDGHELCLGGSGRTLTPGQYVLIEKVDGEWPPEALDRGRRQPKPALPQFAWKRSTVADILDALSDHTEGAP